MKLLILAHRVPYPPNKGEKIRTFNQLVYLSRQGHELTVATPLETPEDEGNAKALAEQFPVIVLTAPIGLNRALRMLRGLFQGQALSISNFRTRVLQSMIVSQIQSQTPDAVLCTSSAMAEYLFASPLMPLLRQQGTRLVMDFMDLDSLKWEQYAARKSWPLSWVYAREARLLNRYEARIYRDFDAALFVSGDEKALIGDTDVQHLDKVQVVANGVDMKLFHPGPDDGLADTTASYNGAPELLFTGVMDYFPNEDAVLWFVAEVWPIVRKRFADARFTIAGMNPSQKIRALSELPGIEITGFVDDMLPYYQRANIFVASFQLARGIQNKVLQALACGLPVVTSKPGVEGISCTPGEHLLVAEQPQEFADAIEKLVSNADLYQRISQAGLELVAEQFSWDSKNARLEEILIGGIANPVNSASLNKSAGESGSINDSLPGAAR
ncbi:MAG: TIGR03087 family PEP-CTERM/XrtA system glycosyltransferase [Granulosicoccus sp.]